MTQAEKLSQLKTLLKITDNELDEELTVYLNFAKAEILNWLYSGNVPEDMTDVPARYETTQVMACVVGYSQSGVEGQISHSENGISRTWKYEDMVAYIRSHVMPYVQVF